MYDGLTAATQKLPPHFQLQQSPCHYFRHLRWITVLSERLCNPAQAVDEDTEVDDVARLVFFLTPPFFLVLLPTLSVSTPTFFFHITRFLFLL
jgi:hypothetical protein